MIKKKGNPLKLNKAVSMIVLIALINLVGVFIFLNISKRSNIKFMTGNILVRLEKNFEDYETNMTKTLESSIDVMVRDEKMAEIFLTGDREALYNYSKELFDHTKAKNYFTHWYFLNTEEEGTCFLRMHNRKLYGDKITRYTYMRSIKTKELYSGKELGKTAFAIRAVHPWYYKGNLIGYIELGIEINSFFENLKKNFDAELGLIIEKSFLDRSKWRSVRKEKGLSDNWHDHKKYLLIEKTTSDEDLIDLSEISKNIPAEKKILSISKKNGAHLMHGVLPLYDASGKKVGIVYFLKDVSDVFRKLSDQSSILMIIIFFFLSILTFFMIYFHKHAEGQLRRYRENLEEMIEERTREVKQEFNARLEAEESQMMAVKLAEKSSKMASLGVMAAGIAHEINQPLNAIKISADSAIYKNENDSVKLDENYLNKLKNISDGVDRITEIITNMRNFWILPEDNQSKSVDINVAVEDALKLVRSQLKSHGIRFHHEKSSQPVKVRCALVHLEQIIVNLLTNAINSLSSSGKGDKFINIVTGMNRNKAVIKVVDNGIGLPDIGMDELMDSFYSTGKSKGGTGLGLAIISHYVKKYKGNIKTEKNKYGGATFIIEFPGIDT